MREATMQHLRRVFKNTLESWGPERTASYLLTQRDLAEAGYRQGRITKNDYEGLIKAFDLIAEELGLLSPELVAQ